MSLIEQSMLTTEIAELTNKQNKHVNRDTELMLNELGLDRSKFGHIYLDSYGREQNCYKLNKKLSLCLVAKYDTKTRMAIIDRWEELETGALKSITEMSRLEILEIAIDSEKKAVALTEANKILETNLETAKDAIDNLAPMAEYGHGVYICKNLYTVTNIGQEIGLSGAVLNKHLKRLGVIRKGTGRYTDYELRMRYANLGLVEYKTSPGLSSSTNEPITHRNLRWTRRGFDWLVSNGDKIQDLTRKSLPLPKNELIKRGA